MAFNILFEGLVCHISQGGKETAVFMAGPRMPRHEVRLVVNNPSDIIAVTLSEDDVFAAGKGRSFQIAGQHLVLKGVIDDAPSVTSEFRRFVPSLSAMTTCYKLRDEVVHKQVTAGVVGYLDHPGGELSVDDYYPFKATIFDGREPETRCVASVVRLTLKPNADEVEIAGERGRLALKPTATIEIMNKTRVPDGDIVINEHFHHYNALFGPGCGLKATPVVTAEKCPMARRDNEKVNGAECSNSHIP